MARLRCRSRAERLLIPPFVLFFFLLYPMRWANRPGGPVAAAAGGSVLVRAEALRRAGGLAAIRGELIDDLALARAVKGTGGTARLALSRGRVTSVRPYRDVAAVWRMVRRSAFTQLRRSWALLAAVTAALALMFATPPACVAAGWPGRSPARAAGRFPSPRARRPGRSWRRSPFPPCAPSACRPAGPWPAAGGVLYALMTIDSSPARPSPHAVLALVVAQVLAALDGLPPAALLPVPADRVGEGLAEGPGRRPAQRAQPVVSGHSGGRGRAGRRRDGSATRRARSGQGCGG